jgi:hypothetical protein
MDLVSYIKTKYPDAEFELADNGDGTFISKWSSTSIQPTMQELMDAMWAEKAGDNRTAEQKLDDLRKNKQRELEASCADDLAYGYQYIKDGVQYRFSFDIEAQLNFQGGKPLLEKGIVPFIPWTAYDPDGKRVRINLTLEDLEGMELAQFHHKSDVTAKYNDLLLNHLYVATTEDDIKAISWGEMI